MSGHFDYLLLQSSDFTSPERIGEQLVDEVTDFYHDGEVTSASVHTYDGYSQLGEVPLLSRDDLPITSPTLALAVNSTLPFLLLMVDRHYLVHEIRTLTLADNQRVLKVIL